MLIRLSLLIVFCVIGCLSPKERQARQLLLAKQQRIDTANKISKLLQEGKTEDLYEMIILNSETDTEIIRNECKLFQYVIKKYGLPDTSKYIYSENPNFIYPYSIVVPVFSGEDTLWNWKVHKINLQIYFAPRQISNAKKVAIFHLNFDDEQR